MRGGMWGTAGARGKRGAAIFVFRRVHEFYRGARITPTKPMNDIVKTSRKWRLTCENAIIQGYILEQVEGIREMMLATISNNQPTEAQRMMLDRLRGMGEAGWPGLSGMGDDELAGLEADIHAASDGLTFEVGTLDHEAIRAAQEALRAERVRRNRAQAQHDLEQQRRLKNARDAARLVREAIGKAEAAHSVEPDAASIPGPMEPPDMRGMNGGQLDVSLAQCRAELQRTDGIAEALRDDAACLRLLGTDAGKALAEEMGARAAQHMARRESVQAAAEAIGAEIDRREAEVRARAEANADAMEDIGQTIADLKARIAELEAAG